MTANESIRIRHATADDVAGLSRFGEEHIAAYYTPLIGPDAAASQVRSWWTPEHFEPAVAARQVLIAEQDSVIVGVAQHGVWDGRPVMWKLYVHPWLRGSGLGPRLIAALIDDLPESTEALLTEHLASNERAGAFYERAGFRELRVEPSPDGEPAKALVWRLLELPA